MLTVLCWSCSLCRVLCCGRALVADVRCVDIRGVRVLGRPWWVWVPCSWHWQPGDVGRQIRGPRRTNPRFTNTIDLQHLESRPRLATTWRKATMVAIFGSSFHEAKLVKVRRFPSALPSLADPLPESSRVLLCARPADISAHSRKVLHPPSREGRLPAAQDYHSPDGRTVHHDHRKRREEDPPRQHQAVT
jgi:hypothetical protein